MTTVRKDESQYEYMTPDGMFDYMQYVKNQDRANKRKLTHQSVKARTVQTICRYLLERIEAPKCGLCHGVRRGIEQQLFKSHLPGCVVVGTEIAHTATWFQDTIQWDFHEIKPEWIGAADFVYSNSLDHAYDPKRAVERWVQSLADPGYCFIEWWANKPWEADSVDCFQATLHRCRELLEKWGETSAVPYSVIDMLTDIKSPKSTWKRGRDGGVFVIEAHHA